MIRTRIVKFVGHIHNMQLCIEMISFINNENESLLRWFYSLCEPRNFSRILCPVAGCIQTGWGLIYDLLLLSCGIRLLMFQPCLDLILICLIRSLIYYSTHTWSSGQPTLWRPGSSWRFGALLKGVTSVVDNSCRDLNPQSRTHNALSIRATTAHKFTAHKCVFLWFNNMR